MSDVDNSRHREQNRPSPAHRGSEGELNLTLIDEIIYDALKEAKKSGSRRKTAAGYPKVLEDL